MKDKYFIGISVVFVLSLILSRYVLSLSIIGLTILGIVQFTKKEAPSFKSFLSEKSFFGFVLVFLSVCLSFWNTEDTGEWLNQVRLKLPFLVLPFAFYYIKPISVEIHKKIHFLFIGMMVLSTFYVLFLNIPDLSNLIEDIGQGKALLTPIDHIHYSILMTYAVLSSFLFAMMSKQKNERTILLLVGMFLFGFIHFLAVRTGLVLSYLGLIGIALYYIISNKKYKLGIAIMVALFVFPFLAYQSMPSLQKKVGYMKWDYQQYKKGEGINYSDSERLMSYNIGFELIKEKPLTGHGIGDMYPIMMQRHTEKYGAKNKYINPHNQYILILVGMGILGFLLFFYGLLSPLIFTRRKNIFLLVILAMMFLSFLVENTIQRAVITAFFVYFIFLNMVREEPFQQKLD